MAEEKWIQAEVDHVESVGDRYRILTLVRPDELDYRAGQHVKVRFKDPEGEFERYYSVASNPENKQTLDTNQTC